MSRFQEERMTSRINQKKQHRWKKTFIGPKETKNKFSKSLLFSRLAKAKHRNYWVKKWYKVSQHKGLHLKLAFYKLAKMTSSLVCIEWKLLFVQSDFVVRLLKKRKYIYTKALCYYQFVRVLRKLLYDHFTKQERCSTGANCLLGVICSLGIRCLRMFPLVSESTSLQKY